MKLEDAISLVREASVEQFSQMYSYPALTFWIPQGPGGAKHEVNEFLHSTMESDEDSPMLSIRVGRNQIGWLRKSENNAFGNIVSVGRARTNDLRLPIETVSKIHAVFMQIGDDWRISDQKATNGLFVNDRQLEPGESVTLSDGDLIRLGREVEATYHTPEGLYQFLQMLT